MTKSDMQSAVDAFKGASTFLVLSHVSPDGDSLGCMCAFALAAESLGKTAVMLHPDGAGELYTFLPGIDALLTTVSKDQRFDLAVLLDCDGPTRLGLAQELLSQCDKILELDHHLGTDRVSDFRIIDSTSASTGEVLYDFLRAADVSISSEIAECLLTAVVTDTGCFRFSNVKPSTLRVASELAEIGASVHDIVEHVYESRTLSAARILGTTLAALKTALDGRVAYSRITREELLSSGADESETEGIANYVRSIRGAKIALLFREAEDGSTRVSLRSVVGGDVSVVAKQFGGGGHRMAAGCTVEKPMNEAIELVISAVEKWMVS